MSGSRPKISFLFFSLGGGGGGGVFWVQVWLGLGLGLGLGLVWGQGWGSFRVLGFGLGLVPHLIPKLFLKALGFLLCSFSCPLVSQRRAYKKELGYLHGRNNVTLRSIIIHPLLLEPLKYLNIGVSILPITFSSY